MQFKNVYHIFRNFVMTMYPFPGLTNITIDDIIGVMAEKIRPEIGRTTHPMLVAARYENLTRHILAGHTKPAELALLVGLSDRQLRRVLREPGFIKVFDATSAKMLDNIDEVIKDETIAISVRKNALHRRAVTILGKTMDAVDAEFEHAIEEGRPWAVRATMVKAGIEAATVAIDRDLTELQPQLAGSKHLHLHITQHDANVLRDTMSDVAEDIDISDVLTSATTVEAEIVQTEEDPGE